MSSALMRLTSNTAELTQLDAMIAAEMAEETTAFDVDLPRIRIAPGGVGQFQVGDEMKRTFSAIVAISQKVRGYWPQKETGSAPPLCSSVDSVIGLFNANPSQGAFEAAAAAHMPHPAVELLSHKGAALPDGWECVHCPLAQWGSAHQNGVQKGQACKLMVRLLLVVDGYKLPAVMSLPPTSLKPWGAYCSALMATGKPYFTVRTRFELDKTQTPTGITYNTVKVALAGPLTPEEVRDVMELRREYGGLVRGAGVDSAEYDGATGAGDVVDVKPSPAAVESSDVPF